MSQRDCFFLAGALGGTRSRFALHSADSRPGQSLLGQPLLRQDFLNQDFSSFDEVLDTFLAQTPAMPQACCFGVAGPVLGRQVQFTNLDWHIDADAISRNFAIANVSLVNDLTATAMGIETLQDTDSIIINKGSAIAEGMVAVIAPGTGLGESFVSRRKEGSQAFATEGGHSDFAPRTRQQQDLLQFMHRRHAHVSYERVCSGRALPELHAFCAARCEQPLWFSEQLSEARDQTPLIVNAALAAEQGCPPCPSALASLELFVDILAAEAANLALKTMSSGGVYICGGLPPRILPFFKPERFMAIFSRGVYADILSRIPVAVVTQPDTALCGAALLALQEL